MSDNSTINTSQCPLCEQPNYCEKAANSNSLNCWCQQSSFDTHLLAQVPPQLRAKVCICKACADKAAILTVDINQENQ